MIGSPDGHNTTHDDRAWSMTGSDKDTSLVEQTRRGVVNLKLIDLMTDPATKDLRYPFEDMNDPNADSPMRIDVSQELNVVMDRLEEKVGKMALGAMQDEWIVE
jgi:hypothetical protein